MLSIRTEQIEVFELSGISDFAKTLWPLFAKIYPDSKLVSDNRSFHRAIVGPVLLAKKRGLQSQREIARYLDTMCRLNNTEGFKEQNHPWIESIFESGSFGEKQRWDMFFSRAKREMGHQ